MSRLDWEAVHRKAWDTYYTPEHIETVMRRGAVFGMGYKRFEGLAYFHHFATRERVHPLEGGLLRRKRRRDRRSELPRENPLTFYPRVVFETLGNFIALLRIEAKNRAIGKSIAADPNRFAYSDRSLTPASESDDDTLDLLTHNDVARSAVVKFRKVRRLASQNDGYDTMDDVWKKLADFLTKSPGSFGVSLSPRAVAEKFRGLTAFEDWDRGQIINRVIVHKGLIDEIPHGLFVSLFGIARAAFANEVFVVYDIETIGDDHVRAAQEAFAKLASSMVPSASGSRQIISEEHSDAATLETI
jgi:hypothetical protein